MWCFISQTSKYLYIEEADSCYVGLNSFMVKKVVSLKLILL